MTVCAVVLYVLDCLGFEYAQIIIHLYSFKERTTYTTIIIRHFSRQDNVYIYVYMCYSLHSVEVEFLDNLSE